MFYRTRNVLLAAAVALAACSDRPLTTETLELSTPTPQFSSVATTTVTSTADAGAGSLRQAILDAPAGGALTTINFAPALANGVITLTTGELAISDKHIVIDASPSTVVISGNNASRVFNVSANGRLELTRVIVQGGAAVEGAGIYNAGSVKLVGSTIRQNTSSRDGGGIHTTGELIVLDSNIRENRSTGTGFWPRGGGLYVGGGTATLTNTTIYQNVFPNYSGDGAQVAVMSGALQMKGGQMYGDFVTFQAQNAPGLYVRGNNSSATLDSVAVYGFRAAGAVGPLAVATGGSLTLTRSRLAASTVQPEPNGALIHNTGGNVVARYNQFVFPSRVVYHGSGTTDVNDNFWGCNGGPNASGCSQARGVTPATWMVITNTPSPAAIALGGASTLSIDASKNSAGQAIAPANLAIFAGRSLDFSGVSLGAVSPANVTLNASFQATATFTGSSTQNGLGGASARMLTQGMGLFHYSTFPASIQVGPSNTAPVANAGQDQTVQCTGPMTAVTLNGSASTDADGNALIYTWKENNVVIASTSQPTVNLAHGTHNITLEVSDGTVTATDVVAINVVDTQPPSVTLNGAASMTIELGGSFTDAGATANDACQGNVAVQTSGSVNTNAVGDYTITYSASDSHGNTASATRTVRVRDTQAPVITLNGSANMTLELGVQSYVEPGATAVDVVNGSIPVQITGSVNSNAAGTYTIGYSATDPSGNSASATRTVRVIDTSAPVITVGAAPLVLWSPNHKYETVALSALGIVAQDAGGVSAQNVVITHVTSDEPDNGLGDGDTPNDMVIATDGRSVQLRAERAGNGNGRVYVIHLGVRDAAGNIGRATYRVSVPKNAKQAAVMDAVVNSVVGVNP